MMRKILCLLGFHNYYTRTVFTWGVYKHRITERVCFHCGHSPTWER